MLLGRWSVLAMWTVTLPLATATADSAVDFNRDIRPILAKNCLACHGPDEETREAGLRLDTSQGARADLGGYRAVEPSKPELSELMVRVESDDPETVMPPPDTGQRLSEQERRLLRAWIAAGGEYNVHWSFVPPQKVLPPKVQQSDWPRQPIDHFVLAKLEAENLTPSEPLDRYRLIRRLSLDLTGLPPTPEQADAFVADPSDDAYEKVVDRLLGTDAFGEHWARMWLDLARYADTKGYEKDLPREMWRYRDWVIDALNQDMPYDQFTLEQLAGDLLPAPTNSQLIATGFHRNTMTNDEGGTDDEEFRMAAVKDRVDTTIQVWMGLTMGCAKCHSHKYDPISHADYYAALAFFNQTEDADRSDDAPRIAAPTASQAREMAAVEQQLAVIDQQLAEEPAGFEQAFRDWRRQFDAPPLWQPLTLADFQSRHQVSLQQQDNGTLLAAGERPDKDTWTVTLDLPVAQTLTAMRLDVLAKDSAGGEWPDANVALRELSAQLISPGSEPQAITLAAARADFSQANWEVAKAIDGDASVGWAISPQIGKPHAAVFDFQSPVAVQEGMQLRLTLDQEYGESLLLARFRVSVSTHPVAVLTADVDSEAGLRRTFSRTEYVPTRSLYQQQEQLQKQLAGLRGQVPQTPVMRELPTDKQRETKLHLRGNFLTPGETVAPAVPDLFGRFPDGLPSNRLGLAHWLMQPENPLTSRVMVNRIWARLFGIGLVETEEDFGTQGTLPTHAQLLDWLAVDFRENGWSLKQLIRSIVLSATYRQASEQRAESRAADPSNRLLSRGPRVRLSAESVRDQALAVSGLLTSTVGGPSVMPPQPPGLWKTTYSALQWEDAVGPDRYRRAIYTFWKRTSPYPASMTFDAGSGEVCQIRRIRTNTPLQALVTLNDTVYLEAAGALARKVNALEGDLAERLRVGFRTVLTRPPDSVETARLVALYQTLDDEYRADPDAAAALLKEAGHGEASTKDDEATAGDAAMVAVANVLLNLDETLTRP